MAHVYLARQEGLEGIQRDVVLKRVLEPLQRDQELITMFLDEARLMAALNHPNIAQVFDLGKQEDAYFLVMEYIDGPSLRDLLSATARAGSRLSPQVSLHIARSVAEALAYLHNRRDEHGRPLHIVHRDLTPANVMVGYTGAVKLIDFGIAKAATRVHETRAGVIKGTFGYSAPEQMSSAQVDHRADVFSLGVLLYQMLTGAHPFAAPSVTETVELMRTGRYRPASQTGCELPTGVDALLGSCLAYRPDDRFPDAQSAVKAIIALGTQLGPPLTLEDLGGTTRTWVPPAYGGLTLLPKTPASSRTSRPSAVPAPLLDQATLRMPSASNRKEETPSAALEFGWDTPVSEPSAVADTIVADAPTPAPHARFRETFLRLSLPSLAILAGIVAFAAASWIYDASTPSSADDAEAIPQSPSAARTLGVYTEPPGATVHLSGTEVGSAPLDLTLPPGTTSVFLRVTAPGYRSQSRRVAGSAGEARFTLVATDAGP